MSERISERISVGGFEGRMLKRKMDEPLTVDGDSELLSLKLGSNNNNMMRMAGEFSSKFTSKSLKGNKNSGFPPKPLAEPSNDQEQRDFACKFCSKKFSSSQALGGHQNAHRRERVLKKMDKEIDKGTFGFGPHLCPYSAMANFPLRGSHLYRGPHHIHPMAHVPATYSWPRCAPAYGNPYAPFAGHRFGMTNPWGVGAGAGAETPLGLNRSRDVGLGFELVDQIPSLAEGSNIGSWARARARAPADVRGLQGNRYMGNQQYYSSSAPDLSLNL